MLQPFTWCSGWIWPADICCAGWWLWWLLEQQLVLLGKSQAAALHVIRNLWMWIIRIKLLPGCNEVEQSLLPQQQHGLLPLLHRDNLITLPRTFLASSFELMHLLIGRDEAEQPCPSAAAAKAAVQELGHLSLPRT